MTQHITRRRFIAGAAGLAAAMGRPMQAQTTLPAARPSTRPARFLRENSARVRPVEFKGDLLNPHIGTETFQRFNGDPVNQDNRWDDAHGPVKFEAFAGKVKNEQYPDTTVAYCRWVWSVIEPEKGKFRWDIIDDAMKAAHDRGQTLHLRLEPFVWHDTPQWYWDAGGTRRGRNGDPDHNNPLYIEHFGNMIREFGKRYDGNPMLEAFDVSFGGPFGEGGGNASAATAATLTDLYIEALPKTQLVCMVDTLGGHYAMQLKHPIGWRVDCFGDSRVRDGQPQAPRGLGYNEMYDEYPRETEEAQEIERWKIAPVVLETCGTVGTWFNDKGDIDWIVEQGFQYHASLFMPKSCAIPDEWRDKIAGFNRKLGYRFVLRQLDLPQHARAGETVAMQVWMENVGVAPIYRPYQLALRFTQGQVSKVVPFAQDLRKWVPCNHYFDEQVAIPRELGPGRAQIDMAIVNDAGEATVKLAIEGIGKDGWHPMLPIEIR